MNLHKTDLVFPVRFIKIQPTLPGCVIEILVIYRNDGHEYSEEAKHVTMNQL